MQKISRQQLELAQEYLDEGLTLKQITQRTFVSKSALENYLGLGKLKRKTPARHYLPKELLQKAQTLLDCGMSYSLIASALDSSARPVTTDMIAKWIDRGCIKRILEPKRIFNDSLKLTGDWVIASDPHVPYTDMGLVRLMLAVAKKFRIKNLLIPGDFLDQAAFSTFFRQADDMFEEELEGAKNLLELLGEWFTEIQFLTGNHDIRMLKLLDFKLKVKTFAKLVGDKYKPSQYPYCRINKKWYITHPKNYSKIATRVAHFLNHREQCHVGVAHGHAMGVTYSPSGREILFDTGGMFDQEKVEYKNLIDTTHGNWISGFSIIYRDHLYQFPKAHTDFNFWLKMKIPSKP